MAACTTDLRERSTIPVAAERTGTNSAGRHLAEQLVAAPHPFAVLIPALLDELGGLAVLLAMCILQVLLVGLEWPAARGTGC
jgi:hypothetical protein